MAAIGSQHLTLDERRSLFRMYEARLGVTGMANLLYMRALQEPRLTRHLPTEPLGDCQ